MSGRSSDLGSLGQSKRCKERLWITRCWRNFSPTTKSIRRLRQRLGSLHARQRLGIEGDRETQVFGQGLNFFQIENFPLSQWLITAILKLTGLYWIGQRNAARVRVRTNDVVSARLPATFDGFTILHLSDLHVDMSSLAMQNVVDL